jgi:hypothetical protein
LFKTYVCQAPAGSAAAVKKRLQLFSFLVTLLVMSKTKGQTFRYRFGNKTKTLWYRSQICLVENRLFQFGPEYTLLDHIEMCSFDGSDLGTNSGVLISFLLDVVCGRFVERLLLYCFDITTPYMQKIFILEMFPTN